MVKQTISVEFWSWCPGTLLLSDLCWLSIVFSPNSSLVAHRLIYLVGQFVFQSCSTHTHTKKTLEKLSLSLSLFTLHRSARYVQR
jgi:hypothetical protein